MKAVASLISQYKHMLNIYYLFLPTRESIRLTAAGVHLLPRRVAMPLLLR